MRPKNKNQELVLKHNRKVRPIGKRVENWLKKDFIAKLLIRYPSGKMNCLYCGNSFQSDAVQSWHDEIIDIKCKCCKNKVEVKQTKNRTQEHRYVFTVLDTVGPYQLIRNFSLFVYYKVGKEPRLVYDENFRIFIDKNGERNVVGKINACGFYAYYQMWNGMMELRNPKNIDGKYDELYTICPIQKLNKFVKESRFKYNEDFGKSISAQLHAFFYLGSTLETIEKRGCMSLYKYCFVNPKEIKKFWPTIKICFRNNYDMFDAQSYFDMIKDLVYLKKDIRNAFYVCPKEFHKAHRKWSNEAYRKRNKAMAKAEKTKKLRELEKEIKAIEDFEARMKRFESFVLETKNVKIIPFFLIEEVKEAGELMSHCIFQSKHYWQDAKNLLLRAYKGNKLVETTQYDLESKTVLHSYGRFNKRSRYHKEIVKAINDNKKTIIDLSRRKIKKPKNDEK